MASPHTTLGGVHHLPGSGGKLHRRGGLLSGEQHVYYLPGVTTGFFGNYNPPTTVPAAGAPVLVPRVFRFLSFVETGAGFNWESVKADLYAQLLATYAGKNLYAGSFGSGFSGPLQSFFQMAMTTDDYASGNWLATDVYAVEFVTTWFSTFGTATPAGYSTILANALAAIPYFPRWGYRAYLYDNRADLIPFFGAVLVNQRWARAVAFYGTTLVGDLGSLGYEYGGVVGKTVAASDFVPLVVAHWNLPG